MMRAALRFFSDAAHTSPTRSSRVGNSLQPAVDFGPHSRRELVVERAHPAAEPAQCDAEIVNRITLIFDAQVFRFRADLREQGTSDDAHDALLRFQ